MIIFKNRKDLPVGRTIVKLSERVRIRISTEVSNVVSTYTTFDRNQGKLIKLTIAVTKMKAPQRYTKYDSRQHLQTIILKRSRT